MEPTKLCVCVWRRGEGGRRIERGGGGGCRRVNGRMREGLKLHSNGRERRRVGETKMEGGGGD